MGCSCYRHDIFKELTFDTNLKSIGTLEDIDFSYRLNKKHPGRLFITPNAKILHKKSSKSRLPSKTLIYIRTVYSFYIFFKNMYESSITNLLAFLWRLLGVLIVSVGKPLIKKEKNRSDWQDIAYLLKSYFFTFRNLKNIRMLKLDFFNKKLQKEIP